MTVTEFAELELTATSVSSLSVQQFFHKVALKQASCSGHPVLFFQDIHFPLTVYLVSGWSDIAAHKAWIASEENQALLREAEGLITVKVLAHIDIDFESMPIDASILRFTTTRDALIPSLCDGLEELGAEYDGWKRSGTQLDGGETVRYWLQSWADCDKGTPDRHQSSLALLAHSSRSEEDLTLGGWRVARAIKIQVPDSLGFSVQDRGVLPSI